MDGWRLDVAHEVSPDFWREFAAECRAERPDCVLLGELIHGDYHRHVAPDLLDSGTNYQLSKALFSRQGLAGCDQIGPSKTPREVPG